MAMCNENENKVPAYELDDGPLTDEQYAMIRKLCPPLPSARITRSLFDVFAEWEAAEKLKETKSREGTCELGN